MPRPDDAPVRWPARNILYVAAAVVLVVVLLSIGRGGNPADAVGLLPSMVLWSLPGAGYLLGAIGYGVLVRLIARGSADRPALVVGLGIAVVATLSQVAGCLGLLSGIVPAALVLLPGWVALGVVAWRWRRARVRVPRPGVLAWLALVPGAVLVVAASAPPGWLWDSEYGGFDALSYHLQLPREWLRNGRLWPDDHCVYSYLPGSFEAGVLHLAALTGAGERGFLGDAGWRVQAAQFFHAWLAVLSAWLVGRAAALAVRSIHTGAAPVGASGGSEGVPHLDSEVSARRAGAVAGVMTLATPWCVVVGSLAYNEMPVIGLGACALLAALDRDTPAWRRGLLAGVLVGAACGFKPTAITFLAPGVGIALLAMSQPRRWVGLVGACMAAGLVTLAPWLTRNWLASGNPVFPFASEIFGSGHWTAEQVVRYRAGHAFEGSVVERLVLLVGPDRGAVPRAGVVLDVQRWRGVLNPQFGVLFPAAVGAAIGLGLAVRPARRVMLLLVAMLVTGVLAWLFTTHLQARFLLPLVLPACVLVGLALGWVRDSGGTSERVRLWLAGGLVAAQAGVLVVTFARERQGGPNASTVAGPALFSGEFLPDPTGSAAAMLGRGLPDGAMVLLVGDSAAFYLDDDRQGGPHARTLWHTTWDTSPLGEAIRASGSEHPGDWARRLKDEGVTHVLINFSELSRYQKSGWYDPHVTPERVTALVQWLGEPAGQWSQTRQVLFTLPDAIGPDGAASGGGR